MERSGFKSRTRKNAADLHDLEKCRVSLLPSTSGAFIHCNVFYGGLGKKSCFLPEKILIRHIGQNSIIIF
ncbi:hypothetical protein D0X99_00360 [Algoriphagus lacus]|uniref:Uncharacterized protein n=1 Tax=Algoriphagus lacus TaxID=2056311 RepID=A0A418PVI5_9BACT|nr:hypothetical protein D0X99_00360 [Algoriphagus lacus]